jgi:hypothetical protein
MGRGVECSTPRGVPKGNNNIYVVIASGKTSPLTTLGFKMYTE